jgi:hypothetical protein
MIRHSRENLKVRFFIYIFPERHNRRNIAAAVTVVGRRPDSYHVLGGEVVFEALVHELVGPSDEFEVVDVVELTPRVSC